MADTAIFRDGTIQMVIASVVAGVFITMLLSIILVLARGSSSGPVLFIIVFAISLTILWFWAANLPETADYW